MHTKIKGSNYNMLRQLPGTNANLMFVANPWSKADIYKDYHIKLSFHIMVDIH